MFAKVFDTARRILSRSPSIQEAPVHPPPATSSSVDADSDMVSTRRGPVGGDTPQSTPVNTRGSGKRALEVEATPKSSVKRRKQTEQPKSADKKADAVPEQLAPPEFPDDEVLDVINVEVAPPSTPTATEKGVKSTPKKRKLPVRKRESPKVIIVSKPAKPPTAADEEPGFHTPVTHRATSVYATPATALKEKEGSSTPKAEQEKPQNTVTPGTTSVRRSKRNKGTASSEPSEGVDVAKRETPADAGLPIDVSSSTTIDNDDTTTSDRERTPVPTAKKIPQQLPPRRTIPDEIPSSTFDSENATLSTQESSPDIKLTASAKLRARLARFYSEELEVPPTSSVPALDGAADAPKSAFKEGDNDDDDGSDSDEAPEIVTAASARSTTQAAIADAVRARKAQDKKEKLKRKERAERIAKEQEEKKIKEEKKAKRLAKIEAKRKPVEEEAPLLDIRNLPALLPESFLEAAGDTRPPTPPPVKSGKSDKELHKEKVNRHIKFLEQSEKPIKDVRKGPVNVRVLAQQNMLLAPKVNRGTRNIREHWLKGRHQERRDKTGRRKMEFHKLERRAPGHGFIRGEED